MTLVNNDLRSDTVTKPDAGMRAAMAAAEVGDDVMCEDPTAVALETRVAAMAGKEAGLFCATGVMANQLCVMAHLLNNGSAPTMFQNVICDARAHVHVYENGGMGINARAHTTPLQPRNGLHLTAAEVTGALQLAHDWHKPVTTLVALENTCNGVVMPLSEAEAIRQALAPHPYIRMHLDGARAWNVMAHTSQPLSAICKPFDSVSLCLSKGLGAPVGSVLVGSTAFVKRCRELRKGLGGGWRQCGILAAACLYALDHHLTTLPAVHKEATRLAEGFTKLNLKLTLPTQTNMVWVSNEGTGLSWTRLSARLKAKGITIPGGTAPTMRLVFHHQIDPSVVDTILSETESELKNPSQESGAPDNSIYSN